MRPVHAVFRLFNRGFDAAGRAATARLVRGVGGGERR